MLSILHPHPLRKYDPAVELPGWLDSASLECLLLFDNREAGKRVYDHAIRRSLEVVGADFARGVDPPGRYLALGTTATRLDTELVIDGWAAGTIAVLCAPSSSVTAPILSDQVTGYDGAIWLRRTNLGRLIFQKYNPVGASAFVQSDAGTVVQDGWYMMSADWGPAGMHVYLDGSLADDNATVDGVRSSPNAVRLNARNAVYGDTRFSFFATWNQQLPAEAHLALMRGLRRPL